jgi:large subunit ribosomal protein L10
VVKNTLARRAVEETPAKKMQELFQGPSTVIWADADPVTPAKILAEFAKDNEKFVIKGAFVDGDLIKADGVEALSKLPSKEELIAKLLSLINAPAIKLLQTISAPGTNLVRVLDAQRAKLEGR